MADRSWCEDERVLEEADLVLRLCEDDDRELLVTRALLALASPVIQDALRCGSNVKRKRRREGMSAEEAANAQQEQAAPSSLTDLPCLVVQGSYQGWTQLLRFLYHAALSGEPAELSLAAAFHILPIAHTYNMAGILASCTRQVQRSKLLPLIPHGPRPPLLTSEVPRDPPPSQEPDLFQWLALADSQQHTPLVEACLLKLADAGEVSEGALPLLRSALGCPQTRARLQSLRSETIMSLLNVVTGLPANFKGLYQGDVEELPRGESVRVVEQVLLHVDSLSGARTVCLKLELDNGLTWEAALELKRQCVQALEAEGASQERIDKVGFYKSRRSAPGTDRPMVQLVTQGPAPQGAGAARTFQVARPFQSRAAYPNTAKELSERYQHVTEQEGKVLWDFWHPFLLTHCHHGEDCPLRLREGICLSGSRLSHKYIITGAVLPILNQILEIVAGSNQNYWQDDAAKEVLPRAVRTQLPNGTWITGLSLDRSEAMRLRQLLDDDDGEDDPDDHEL